MITDEEGKVTLAVISTQIENIQTDVGKINGKIDKSNEGINDLNIKTAVIEKGQEGFGDRIDSFGDRIDGLQKKSDRNDGFVIIGNFIVVAIGAAAGYLGLRR